MRVRPHARLWVAMMMAASRGVPAAGTVLCEELYSAMVCCVVPRVDPATQAAVGCTPTRQVSTRCYARDGVTCVNVGGELITGEVVNATDVGSVDALDTCGGEWYNTSLAVYNTTTACNYIDPDNLHKFWVAMVLSVFFGPLGFDRFYLGYYAIGLAKLCTFGFLCLGWIADVVFIALQVVTPADGTDYYMGYYDTRFKALYAVGSTRPDDIYADFTCET